MHCDAKRDTVAEDDSRLSRRSAVMYRIIDRAQSS